MTESTLSIPERPKLSHARALLLITLFALPLLLLHLGNGDATDMMELFNLVPVREAVRDGHWLMPTLNGLPRLEKPPLPVWLPASLAAIFHTDALWVVRLPSILAALATCVATYFLANRFTCNRVVGLLSALALAAMIQFLRHARLASYDVYATCFTTLGLLGLVLITERSEPTSSNAQRRTPNAALAILLSGISLGLAILSKGPVPVATVCLPFGLWALIYHRRWQVVFHIFLAAVLSLAVFLPWLVVIGNLYPGAWGVWYREILQNSTAQSNNPMQSAADLHRPFYYYLQFLLWVFPLTPTLIAGLALPFLTPRAQRLEGNEVLEHRGRLLFGLMVITGVVLLSCLAEKKIRYALPLFPASAILCAAVFRELIRAGRRSTDGDAASGNEQATMNGPTKILLAANALLFFGVALAIPLAHLAVTERAQRVFASWSPQNPKLAATLAVLPDSLHAALGVFPGLLWLTLSLIFFLLFLYLWVEQFNQNFRRATVAFFIAAWLLNLTWGQIYYGSTYFHTNPQRADAEALVQAAGNHTIYTLQEVYNPWLPLLYYSNRPMPQISAAGLQQLVQSSAEPVYLLVPRVPAVVSGTSDPILLRTIESLTPLQSQLVPVLQLNDGHYDLTLYQAH